MAEIQSNLADIVDKNDELETLKALRLKLAKTIDESKSGRDIAALSRQLTSVTKRISEIEDVMRMGVATAEIEQLIAGCAGMRVR